jgi:hypothetical protein
MVPLWLDEGVAEYFEEPPTQRPHNRTHLRRIRWEARWGRAPAIASLERLSSMEQMRASHYRDAWSWVHFMLNGPPEANQELRAYLSDIADHRPPGSLGDRLNRRIPDLQLAYLRHFRRWR